MDDNEEIISDINAHKTSDKPTWSVASSSAHSQTKGKKAKQEKKNVNSIEPEVVNLQIERPSDSATEIEKFLRDKKEKQTKAKEYEKQQEILLLKQEQELAQNQK